MRSFGLTRRSRAREYCAALYVVVVAEADELCGAAPHRPHPDIDRLRPRVAAQGERERDLESRMRSPPAPTS
jgi:hypothetical protein